MDVNGAKQLATKLLMKDVGMKRGVSQATKDAMELSLHNLFKGSGMLDSRVPEGNLANMVKWRFVMTVVKQGLNELPGMKAPWYSLYEHQVKLYIAKKARTRG